jgi:23S rRNA pseudouridine2604 synthase
MSIKYRLNKFISDSGVCSRREADKYIELGHVYVNGKRAAIGTQVSVSDKVMLNGQLIEPKNADEFVLLAFNKPVGIVSTTEIGVKDSIVDYIGYHERIFPIGRLDKDSQGLIFLTNNGDIVNKILRAGNGHEKEYVVTVNKPVTEDFILKMGAGVPILGEMTKKCKVKKESVYSFRITLIQGLNRQIRRMCDYFEYEVVKLERVRIMNINLKGLPLGEWRLLEANEMAEIMKSIANSTSTAKSSTSMSKQPLKSRGAKSMAEATAGIVKKNNKASNQNPKARELRERSSNSNGRKNGSPKHTKPSNAGPSKGRGLQNRK